MNNIINNGPGVKIKESINTQIILNVFIVLYAFFLPISRAGVAIASICLILIWLYQMDFKNKFFIIMDNKFILALFTFLLYSCIAIIWSSDKAYAFWYIKKYWHFLLVPIIYTSLKKEYIKYVFSAFLLGMFISEIVSYGIFLEIWTKEGVSPNDPSPFMDHTNYSGYLAITIFILFHRILDSESLKWKIIYGLYCLFSTGNLFVNGGRTGQAAFLVAIFIAVLMHVKNKVMAIALGIVISVSLFSVAYGLSPVFKARMDYAILDVQKMIVDADFTNSFSARVALWISGAEAFLNQPFLGTGLGDEVLYAEANILKYNLGDSFRHARTPNYIDYHNMYIQYLVQLGLVGFACIVAMFYYLLKSKIKNQTYFNLKILFVVVYMILSCGGNTLHINQSMVLFVLFTSVFVSIASNENKNILSN